MKTVTLKNGLRIVFSPVEQVKTCAMGIWVASGSGYETPETAGVSHFIEHMVFKGTQKRSALDIARETDALGSIINAYTAKDYTCFYAQALSENATKVFDIICDMVNNPTFPSEVIETEKSVIMEEFSMYEDSLDDLCSDTFCRQIWKKSMLGFDILGTRETVLAMNREKLLKHLKKFYVPERTVVSFCGKFDENELTELCKEYFESLEDTGSAVEPDGAEYFKNITVIKKESLQNQLVIGFSGITSRDPRRHSAAIMSSILGGSSSSRLFQKLREELGLVYSIDTANTKQEKAGYFAIYMALSAKSEKRAIEETIKIIKEFPQSITQNEIDIAIEQGVSGYVIDNERITNLACSNALEMLFYGFIDPEDEVVRRIRSVTLEDVRSIAKEILDIEKISLCAVGNIKTKETYKKYIESVKHYGE